MIRYLIAMSREAEMFKKYSDVSEEQIDVIGINAADFDADKYTENDILVNIGYAGGYKIPVGTLIEPSFALDILTWEAVRIDAVFPIDHRICLTSNTFIEEPLCDGPSIYDMELFKIAQVPHDKLYSIKIVSDNLSEKDCEEINGKAAWAMAAEYIKKYVKKQFEE